ncbi:hypothetical protein [Pseudomonas sp. Irchel 3E13]|uniref:hypothetical protein n=1 Tax=Pseudomonas sp. Irchel 3E13 TaxID=2008975 RepID=UPI000BA31B72|nr:hypothetical protein [Pseudomonas sp. Irchel 3E13]
MNEYTVPLRRVMLLQATLENGGTATCQMRRPETSTDMHIAVENDDRTHHLKATFGPITGSLTLQRGDTAKYMALRDYLEELANGRAFTGEPSQQAIALMEAQDCVNGVLPPGHIAYIVLTTTPARPLGAVVTDAQGELRAAATGTCMLDLAEIIRAKLGPGREGPGESP